ncbi:MAG: FAD synthetase, partial [Kiritimatiellae bacterium]|nr:FAD synthetase [Kiritimatiellia bacterium]
MYSFDWNPKTGGYVLNTQSVRFVAHEIRPVFAEELKLVGFDAHFKFDETETRPICWARQNVYIHKGEEIARLEKTQYGKPLNPVFLAKKNYRLT